jgi:hypothetical protein
MVERPIKKSDRQAVDSKSDVVSEVKETEGGSKERRLDDITRSSEERKTPRLFGGKIKPREEVTQSAVGFAPKQRKSCLMRGPKPTKPKPPCIQETESAPIEESEAETEQETIAEG